jgi:hypothetical protein
VGRNKHGLDLAAQRGAAVFLLWLAGRPEVKIFWRRPALGCPPKTPDPNSLVSSGRRRAQGDVKQSSRFAANASGPSRIIEFNLLNSMRPFCGFVQAPGVA